VSSPKVLPSKLTVEHSRTITLLAVSLLLEKIRGERRKTRESAKVTANGEVANRKLSASVAQLAVARSQPLTCVGFLPTEAMIEMATPKKGINRVARKRYNSLYPLTRNK